MSTARGVRPLPCLVAALLLVGCSEPLRTLATIVVGEITKVALELRAAATSAERPAVEVPANLDVSVSSAPSAAAIYTGKYRSLVADALGTDEPVTEQRLLLGPGEALLWANEQGRPFIAAVDSTGVVRFTIDRPTIGLTDDAADPRLGLGFDDGVAMGFLAQGRVGVRTWHGDGSINADFDVLAADDARDFAFLRVDELGWFVAVAHAFGVILGRLDGDGRVLWPGGRRVGAEHATSSVALAWQKGALCLVQVTEEGDESRRVMASRLDAAGEMIWSAPVLVGSYPKPTSSAKAPKPTRVQLRAAPNDRLEVAVLDDEKTMIHRAIAVDGSLHPVEDAP